MSSAAKELNFKFYSVFTDLNLIEMYHSRHNSSRASEVSRPNPHIWKMEKLRFMKERKVT